MELTCRQTKWQTRLAYADETTPHFRLPITQNHCLLLSMKKITWHNNISGSIRVRFLITPLLTDEHCGPTIRFGGANAPNMLLMKGVDLSFSPPHSHPSDLLCLRYSRFKYNAATNIGLLVCLFVVVCVRACSRLEEGWVYGGRRGCC